MIEIERKFLVNSLPEGLEGEVVIQQGYLAHDEHEHLEIRLRRYGKKHFLTVKEGAGLSRQETEIEIKRPQFDQLWPYSEGRRLEKNVPASGSGATKWKLTSTWGNLHRLWLPRLSFLQSRRVSDSNSLTFWDGK